MSAIKHLIAGLLLAVNSAAFAAAMGGLTTATSAAEEIQTWLYTFVGVAAIIYLIVMGVLVWTELKTWADFGWAVVKIACVGGAIGLAGWAWSLFA
jgi:uncharacterized membrane protein